MEEKGNKKEKNTTQQPSPFPTTGTRPRAALNPSLALVHGLVAPSLRQPSGLRVPPSAAEPPSRSLYMLCTGTPAPSRCVWPRGNTRLPCHARHVPTHLRPTPLPNQSCRPLFLFLAKPSVRAAPYFFLLCSSVSPSSPHPRTRTHSDNHVMSPTVARCSARAELMSSSTASVLRLVVPCP